MAFCILPNILPGLARGVPRGVFSGGGNNGNSDSFEFCLAKIVELVPVFRSTGGFLVGDLTLGRHSLPALSRSGLAQTFSRELRHAHISSSEP